MKATVGGIVHYGAEGSEPRAAIITELHAGERDEVSLVVFTSSGFSFVQRVPFSDQQASGHWSLPPRVEEKQPSTSSAPQPVTAQEDRPAATPQAQSAPATTAAASPAAATSPAAAPSVPATAAAPSATPTKTAPAPTVTETPATPVSTHTTPSESVRVDGWYQDAEGRWHPPRAAS